MLRLLACLPLRLGTWLRLLSGSRLLGDLLWLLLGLGGGLGGISGTLRKNKEGVGCK